MSDRNKELRERIEKFVIDSINLAHKITPSITNKPLIVQLVKASSSIGANYQEACLAESSNDFVHKIKIANKECHEANYWLRILRRFNETLIPEFDYLIKESEELGRIFSSIMSKFK